MTAANEDSFDTNDLNIWVMELQAGNSNPAEPQFAKILARVERITRAQFAKFPRIGRFVDFDDVLQGTLIRMLSLFRELRPASRQDFYRLVNTLIRRELLDLTRRYYGPVGPGTHESAELTVDPDAREVTELDTMTAFHTALEKLPANEREVLSLVYYHGWSQIQIADLFGVSTKTVQRWQEHGKNALRRAVPSYEWN